MIPAGRELDKIIAEKVMGWTEDNWGDWHDANGENETGHQFYPFFSTDIAAAWLVVEKTKIFTERQYVLSNEGDWIISEEVSPAGAYGITGKAPTVAHCICLAALKAVGVEV